jgi:DNA-directed RNA polymerase subunit N (RpoN/RPB10)
LASPEFEPPKCLGCGKPLSVVYENEYWTYEFNEKMGTYEGNLADIEIRCPDCHATIGRQFPEGACNYQTLISTNMNEPKAHEET